MPLLVRAFPLRRPVEEMMAFVDELRMRRQAETDAFYRSYGVSHESWHVQETPTGPWVIAVAMIDDVVEAGPRYADSVAAFDAWFKDQVRTLTGIDPNKEPLGPPTTRVFAWSDGQRPGCDLCA